MKILIECHHGIGDVVMTFPALYNLRKLYPKAQIDMLLGIDAVVPIVKMTDFIDDTYVLHDRNVSIISMFKYGISLRKNEYDIGIAMGQSPRGIDVLFLKISGCKRIIGMKNEHSIYKNYESVEVEGLGHRSKQYIEYVKYLGANINSTNEYVKLDLNKKAIWCKKLKIANKKIIGVFIGAGAFMYRHGGKKCWYNIKEWRIDNWLKITEMLLENDYNVILLGGAEDAQNVSRNNIFFPDTCKNYIGKLSLVDTVYILSNCDFVVGCDSGPMHCAALVGTPTLTLFGATDSDYIGPVGENANVIYANTPCTKCYPHEIQKGMGCIPPKCMESLSVDVVAKKIFELVKLL